MSDLGKFVLTSDSIINTYFYWKRTHSLIQQLEQTTVRSFVDLAHTIGGYLVFPGNRIGKATNINGERGINRRILDRFDLTLECIRRHYLEIESPLSPALTRYHQFFTLFESFEGYVDFFLLNDLVSDIDGSVKFFLPSDNFAASPLPQTAQEYQQFRERAMEFINARNALIMQFVSRSGYVAPSGPAMGGGG